MLFSNRSGLRNTFVLVFVLRISFPFLCMDMGTEEARRMARLLVRGDRLWRVGTVQIIERWRGIVKARRRRISRPYYLRANFTPIQYFPALERPHAP